MTSASPKLRRNIFSAIALLLFALPVTTAEPDEFSIDWFQIGHHETESNGEEFTLTGSIGDPIPPQPLTGEDYTLTGGASFMLALQTEGAPPLAVYFTAQGAAVITWPSASPLWQLQQRSTLNQTVPWAAPPETVQTGGDFSFIVVDRPEGIRFFRLQSVSVP